MSYKHNDLLEALVEVGKTNDKPWEEFDWLYDVNVWVEFNTLDELINRICVEGCEWRRKPKDKPPIGLLPKHIWNINRTECIVKAMRRYVDAGKEIPIEWLDELREIRTNQ